MSRSSHHVRSPVPPLGRLVARLLACVLALQTGGLLHDLLDLAQGVSDWHEPCAAGDEDCPPGCEDCVCAHAIRPAVPVTERSADLVAPGAFSLVPERIVEPVTSPPTDGVFHPPRA